MIYCHTCDLAFCEQHEKDHDLMPSMEHRTENVTTMDVPCCVCSGILRSKGEA